MKLLFDQNLSYRIVEDLKGLYPNSTHVRLIGLQRAVFLPRAISSRARV
ncbi:MAG TPA: DUF5615 family PIN-like protein [Terriglobia bacterium]|nr:DUF5615 family PIN-like protein [Terriglobia bacterium]